MRLEENFTLDEFNCRDGSEIPEELIPNVKLLAENLQVLRNYVNRPIHIISGYRTPEYNKKISGARESQHMLAKAADIKVEGMEPWIVHKIIEHLISEGHMMKGGLALYKTFVHYDIRGRNARWTGEGVKDDKPLTKY
jgi:uncharacterized protein YcbK (DUF882 family)